MMPNFSLLHLCYVSSAKQGSYLMKKCAFFMETYIFWCQIFHSLFLTPKNERILHKIVKILRKCQLSSFVSNFSLRPTFYNSLHDSFSMSTWQHTVLAVVLFYKNGSVVSPIPIRYSSFWA